jgi:hypothetical protein
MEVKHWLRSTKMYEKFRERILNFQEMSSNETEYTKQQKYAEGGQ